MGGTASILHGILSPRLHKQGSDKGGRWSWITINGKNRRQLCIISAYRVNDFTTNNAGDNTAWRSQERFLIQQGHVQPNPREQMLKDLKSFINTQQQSLTDIVLLMDANQSITSTSSKQTALYNFMVETGLIHAMQTA